MESSEINKLYHGLRFSAIPFDGNPKTKNFLESSYQLWRQNWTEAYRELNQFKATETAYSDNFCRQGLILSLDLYGKCIATACMRFLDMNYLFSRDDSYLSVWDRDSIAGFGDTERIVVASGFTLDKGYRLKVYDLPSIYLFHTFVVKIFKDLGHPKMISIVRNDVGLHKLVAKYGTTSMKEDVPYANTFANLVVYESEKVITYPLSKYKDVFSRLISSDVNTIAIPNSMKKQTKGEISYELSEAVL
ncbi:MAG: hypothetical protein COT74_02550 [Bdellovibrionales bacterium CG10_big_fil_rev_8_21_14_0_10_45_34]|nr:MAG: hypothetical protein COT74_02550 [Bdellovibrionales bacterium CG10_big_fil_rev_8_21_14_0_10_45_34]